MHFFFYYWPQANIDTAVIPSCVFSHSKSSICSFHYSVYGSDKSFCGFVHDNVGCSTYGISLGETRSDEDWHR